MPIRIWLDAHFAVLSLACAFAALPLQFLEVFFINLVACCLFPANQVYVSAQFHKDLVHLHEI